jgi:SAM-dependent methyltransferase
MHETAMMNGKRFFACYGKLVPAGEKKIVIDIGSQDINGSLREVAPKDFKFVGVDVESGKGVDVVLDDPYTLPFESDSVDIVTCSSCFEHSEMFWLLFLEIIRVLKPTGLLYLNVPSNGDVHRYPVDCWRFYPDSGKALVVWAKRNGINSCLLESYTGLQRQGWKDFVAVFLKDEMHADLFRERIVDSFRSFENGYSSDGQVFLNSTQVPEERRNLKLLFGYAAAEILDRRLKMARPRRRLSRLLRG